MLLLGFSVLTWLAVERCLQAGPDHDRLLWLTTAATLTGPLTGAIARQAQDCCLEASLSLLWPCAPVQLLGIVAQFVPLPDRRWRRPLRLSLWTLGWLVWFLGGLVSFLHALE